MRSLLCFNQFINNLTKTDGDMVVRKIKVEWDKGRKTSMYVLRKKIESGIKLEK